MEAKIQARIDPSLKKEGEKILHELGMSTTELVRMTFRQLVMRKGLPFDVKIPNAETVKALEEDLTEAPHFQSVDDLITDLNSED